MVQSHDDMEAEYEGLICKWKNALEKLAITFSSPEARLNSLRKSWEVPIFEAPKLNAKLRQAIQTDPIVVIETNAGTKAKDAFLPELSLTLKSVATMLTKIAAAAK